MGHDAIIQADDKDGAELEAFGSVQGQQGGGVLSLGERVLVGDECHVLQELVHRPGGIFHCQAAQLLYVLPAFVAFLGTIIEILMVVDIVDNTVEQFNDGQTCGLYFPVDEQTAEVGQRQGGPTGELFPQRGSVTTGQVHQRRARCQVRAAGGVVQGEDGLVPNATRWEVDDPVERDFVRRIMHQPQVGDDVFDLAAAIKFLRSHQPIGKAGLQEGFFEQAGLGVGAVHHGAVAGFAGLGSYQPGDGIHYEGCFGVVVEGFVKENFIARAAVAEKLLLSAMRCAVDDRHGRVQNVLA